MELFTSALPYTKVRDFAYHDKHPLHYGVRQEEPRKNKDDIYRRAISLFDFEPENENEAQLKEGQIVYISYRHGQGWLVAENLETGETGLVPEEYVQVLPENEEEWVDA